MELKKLAQEIYKANKKKGFWPENPQERNKGELLMLVTSELAEALEADRDGHYCSQEDRDALDNILATSEVAADWKEQFENRIKNSYFDEIADSIIRLLDMCGGLGIDIDWHIENKLRYNAMRGHKHGRGY